MVLLSPLLSSIILINPEPPEYYFSMMLVMVFMICSILLVTSSYNFPTFSSRVSILKRDNYSDFFSLTDRSPTKLFIKDSPLIFSYS